MGITNILMLCGGIGFFIYGVKFLGQGLEKVAGFKFRKVLETLTSNRLFGTLLGAAATCVTQSAGATTVMAMGFVNAGLLSLRQIFGIIIGANIGSSFTARLFSFNISEIAPVVALLGVIFMAIPKRRNINKWGPVCMGFAILFVGLSLMSESMAPLRHDVTFQSFLTSFNNPISVSYTHLTLPTIA